MIAAINERQKPGQTEIPRETEKGKDREREREGKTIELNDLHYKVT